MKPIHFVIIASLLFGGCSWVNTIVPSDREEVFRDALWTKEQEVQFDSYIGKTSQEIEAIFGRPTKIYKANPPSYNLPYGADEMWRYEELSVGEGGLHNFLFKQNNLIRVQVLFAKQSKTGKTLNYLLM